MNLKSTLFILFCTICSFGFLRAQVGGAGSCLDFGLNKYVDVPHNTTLNPTNDITIEAWIKADSWHPQFWGNVIVSKDGWGNGERGYTLRCGQNGRLSFNFGTNPGWHEAVSGPVMSLNTWYHVAGTFNGTVLKVYVNGKEEGSLNFTGSIVSSTYPLRIGAIAYTAAGFRPFDGLIDEICIWDRALSQNEIRELMHLTKEDIISTDPNLKAYLQFNEPNGKTYDKSGNGFHTTMNSGNLNRIPSTAPVGGGTSARAEVNSGGVYELNAPFIS